MFIPKRAQALVPLFALLVVALMGCSTGKVVPITPKPVTEPPTATKVWLEGNVFSFAKVKGAPVLIEAWHPS